MRSKKPTLGARLGSQLGSQIAAQIESQIESTIDAALASSFPAPAGLRERKKVQTRVRISDIATRLFLEHGFDEVTVADVAKAADVSVKTVFNYFGAKEDLLFDREPEFLTSVEGLRQRCAPGCGLIRVLRSDVGERWPATDFGRWEGFNDDSIGGRRAFYRLVEHHPGLRARRRQMNERIGKRLAAIAAEAFEDPDSPEAVTAGALVSAAYEVTGRELARALLSDRPAREVVERARATGQHALGVLERAYAGTPLVDGPPA